MNFTHTDIRLEALFEPRTVAVVGASRDPHKIGHIVLANLIAAGYKGRIFPVNPAGGELLGLEVLSSVAELPDEPDLAVICLPREKVIQTVEELAKKDVRAVIVVTAGFREVGKDGYMLEQQLRKVSKFHDIALLGPNCLGMINTEFGVNASFITETPAPGNVSFFSQSGALCSAILDWAVGDGIGFSKFVSLGNEAVLKETHLLGALGNDPATKVVLGYCESVDDGQDFMRIAERVTAKKPVIMLKAGTTTSGARAVSSHTGTVAGSTNAYKAAFTQSGIIDAPDVETLFSLARAFSTQPLPTGPNLCVVTNSGGPGILAADACENSSLTMARPGPEALEKLREALPPFAALYNPIDIIGDADAERYRTTLEIAAQDEMTHTLLVVLSPTASAQIKETAQAVIDVARKHPKPVFAVFMGGERIGPGRNMLLEAGIPCYAFPEPAIEAIEAMYQYRQWKENNYPVEVCFRRDKNRAERVLSHARRIHLQELTGAQALEVALAYEMPVPEFKTARTSDQAVRAAKKIGYPVSLKIISPQLDHRSDVDGVALNLATPQDVRAAFREITNRTMRLRPDAYVAGCMVQAMAPAGCREIRVGFVRDPQFGPLINFGLGGVSTEILEDFSRRLAPLTLGDAQDMVRDIKSFPLLRGVRGETPVDLGAIEDLLLTVSQLAQDFTEIKEAEFSPVLVNHEGVMVADARLTIG